jgi:hypothetical protein
MKRPFSVLILSFILLGHSLAFAQVLGKGAVYWGNSLSMTTTPACVPRVGSATCALFPAGSGEAHRTRYVEVDSNAPFRLCFVGDTSVSITGYSITDAGTEFGSGSGACVGTDATAGAILKEQPRRVVMVTAQKAGTRTGLCPRPVTNEGETLYAPCDLIPDATTDCASFGGGNCNMTPSDEQVQNAGTFVLARTVSGTGVINVLKKIEVK